MEHTRAPEQAILERKKTEDLGSVTQMMKELKLHQMETQKHMEDQIAFQGG